MDPLPPGLSHRELSQFYRMLILCNLKMVRKHNTLKKERRKKVCIAGIINVQGSTPFENYLSKMFNLGD